MVGKALRAAEHLAEDGIDVEVIDLRSIYPVDWDTLEASGRKTGKVVVVTESPLFGSVASEIAATLTEQLDDVLVGPVIRLGAEHTPIPHSPPLVQALIPQVPDLEAAVRRAVTKGHR